MTDRTFTPEERDRFVRNGFVVIRDAVPEDILGETRRAVAETVPEDLTDAAELVDGPEDRHYWNDLDDMTPFGPLNAHLHGYAEDLVGSDRLQSPREFTQVAVRYPTGRAPGDPDAPMTAEDGNAHVDVVGDEGDLRPFTVGATAYLDDVHPRGGGLTVWPGTHRRVGDYVRGAGDVGADGEGFDSGDSDTEEFDGGDSNTEDFDGDGLTAAALDRNAAPFEVTGRAGTVVLWHSLLFHTGGSHLGRRPRIASFTRFEHRDQEGIWPGAMADPFGHWDGVDARE